MMRNSRRGLAAGVNFIWDLPMTLVLSLRNITSHRRRLSKPEFNSIQIGSLVWIWMRCAPDAGAWRCISINPAGIGSLNCNSAACAPPVWPLFRR